MKNFFLFTIFLFLLENADAQMAKHYLCTTYENIDVNEINNNAIKMTEISSAFKIYSVVSDFEQDTLKSILSKKFRFSYFNIDRIAEPRGNPSDSLFAKQWDMVKIKMNNVWNNLPNNGLSANGDTIVVGIIEIHGYDIKHSDLVENIWKNNREIPNNNIDDDKNGYIDDFLGLNILTKNDKHSVSSHGTSVAGIIGAKGNNKKGVTGVNWNIKMALVSECEYESQIIAGYLYFLNLRKKYNESNGKEGAFIVATNASWGFPNSKAADFPLLCNIYDELGKVGILSVAATENKSIDVDVVGDIPSNCNSEHLIIVSNTTKQDKLYEFSAFGKISVDLSAPGQESFTLLPFNQYGNFGGCSAATPHVTGAIALLYGLPSKDFGASLSTDYLSVAKDIKEAILNGVDKIEGLSSKSTTGGRLNVEKSYTILLDKYTENVAFGVHKVYPNPIKDFFNISYSVKSFSDISIVLVNVLGAVVYKETIKPQFISNNLHQINLPNLSAGYYRLYLSNFEKTLDFSYSLIKI